MRVPGKKSSFKEYGKPGYSGSLANLTSSPKVKKPKSKSSKTIIASALSKKRGANSSSKASRNYDADNKLLSRKGFRKEHDTDSSKNPSAVKLQHNKLSDNGSDERGEKRRRKKKPKKDKEELDETSRLQRRTRYLLIKIKLEHNLIDAYAGEGWKGQSREKIRPEMELQRANKQILNCKLGIRDAIHQLDSLSSVGSIADSFISPDGSVSHEHIFCAKCKLNEAFPDNDIILCDGTCNCAFHQKCLDPPLDTENIPRGEQGWFCKFCECKMEILELVNAHLGTCFPMNSGWQDVFKEEATFPHGKNSLLNPDEEWPSDDSEDDDYNPERNENSCSISRGGSDDIASEEELSTDVSVGSDVSTDGEIVSSRRQKRSVDYKKLYDEMFGKDGPLLEQISDDEDWGPGKRKRRGNESDAASTLMTLYESERNPDVDRSEKKSSQHSSDTQVRRSCFRIPRNAVEKLRQVFSENELPSRAVKDNLSKELGLNPEKVMAMDELQIVCAFLNNQLIRCSVSKWFKNARYLALKTRKGASGKDLDTFTPGISKAPGYENVTGKAADLMASDSDDDTLAETVVHSPKNAKAFRRKHPKSLSSPLKKSQQKGPSCGSRAKSSKVFVLQNKDGKELSDDVSLKKLRNTRTKEKRANLIAGGGEDGCRVPELEMERLCKAKGRLEYMRQKLLKFQIVKAKQKSNISRLHEQSVIYVPIAEVKENV
ncbi:pathogenesis-related homeodomain protein-like isoform X3 [Malus sylvestris]|uniref:pathogenesis-related homeodomain protein-like isoform X3 n=1 Tax=Malus sylvestris TaxID=3752 RepID=UPI0010AAC288|nr:pathogenesis-related homeodomain protein isoform X3 [Malus domestica]XP_050118432.1 pathogenesis-related homeodomain protein-like isoform X3 [Malus sylvestris]